MNKKALIENVFSTVVMIILFIIIGISLYSHTSRDIVHNYRAAEQIFSEDTHSNSLNTVLEVDEAITGERMSRLVAKRVFYRQEIINVSGHEVNITHEFKTLLDQVYGEGTYFAIIEPLISDLTLTFVFDGSPSMNDEREVLADVLPGLLATLEQRTNLSVREKIYILNDPDDMQHLCDPFKSRQLHCELVDHDMMYLPTSQYCSPLNSDYRSKYCIAYPYKYLRLAVDQFPGQDYSPRDRGTDIVFTADWASGITYALKTAELSLSYVNIIFPISEELSTSSFNDMCFTDDYYAAPGDWYQRTMWCDLCTMSDNDPTLNRALRTVQSAIDMSADVLNDVIYPIYSIEERCNYEYYISRRHYLLHFWYTDNPGGGPNLNLYCGQVADCQGCQDVGSLPGPDYVCLHPELEPHILNHMQMLADATGGNVTTLKDRDKLADLIDTKVTDTLDSLLFTVGQEQNKTRLGFERLLTLPGSEGNFARLRLYKYPP